MKWMFLLIVGFTMLSPCTMAQPADSAQIAVHYKFSHVRDTTHPDKPQTENMVLLVGKKSGVYKTNEAPMKQQVSTNPDGTTRVNTRYFGTQDEYYQFPNEKRLIRKEVISLNDAFIITDALPVIDWHILNDTATLDSLHCQKATAHFKGRDYTAWFCADLPLHIGPWKLNGLPGIIVEAYDATNTVRFSFNGISKPDPTAILPPEEGIKTTDKEFSKLKAMSAKDPEAYSKLMAQYGSGGAGPRPMIKPGSGIKPKAGPVINNPIELPESK